MKKKLQLNKETMSILNAKEMSKVVGQADGTCPSVDASGHTVFLPNPGDCSTFFLCSNGVPILMHCQDGLHFNAELDVCDWPQDAGCEAPAPAVTESCTCNAQICITNSASCNKK